MIFDMNFGDKRGRISFNFLRVDVFYVVFFLKVFFKGILEILVLGLKDRKDVL